MGLYQTCGYRPVCGQLKEQTGLEHYWSLKAFESITMYDFRPTTALFHLVLLAYKVINSLRAWSNYCSRYGVMWPRVCIHFLPSPNCTGQSSLEWNKTGSIGARSQIRMATHRSVILVDLVVSLDTAYIFAPSRQVKERGVWAVPCPTACVRCRGPLSRHFVSCLPCCMLYATQSPHPFSFSILLYYQKPPNSTSEVIGVYEAMVLLGIGGTILYVTSLSMVADLIGFTVVRHLSLKTFLIISSHIPHTYHTQLTHAHTTHIHTTLTHTHMHTTPSPHTCTHHSLSFSLTHTQREAVHLFME